MGNRLIAETEAVRLPGEFYPWQRAFPGLGMQCRMAYPNEYSLAVGYAKDQFHLSLISHHSRCDPALSVFASKCMGEYHAGTAALCDLGDPGWGIPGFRIELLLLLSPNVAL